MCLKDLKCEIGLKFWLISIATICLFNGDYFSVGNKSVLKISFQEFPYIVTYWLYVGYRPMKLSAVVAGDGV